MSAFDCPRKIITYAKSQVVPVGEVGCKAALILIADDNADAAWGMAGCSRSLPDGTGPRGPRS
jgi:hypothetical protein